MARVHPSGTQQREGWLERTSLARGAWIEPSGSTVPKGAQNAGWLPSKRFAEAWLAFEKAREHPVTPLE